MKVVIVGCTHAGTNAAINILKNYPDMDVTVYEKNDNLSFLSCGIALYVGGVVKNDQGLFYSSPEELTQLGANVHMKHQVLSIDTQTKSLTVKNLTTNEEFVDSYDRLVMTTGSWPTTPNITGLDLDNVLFCKNYHHGKEIMTKATQVNHVTVVGAGYIGVELVEAFHQLGKQVHLIDGLDSVLNKYLDKEFANVVEERLVDKGVQLSLGEDVIGFNGQNGKVSTVETTKQSYSTGLVVLCLGFRPMTDLLKGQVEMLPNGAIIVDEYMRTSLPDVFAAGDSTVVHFNPTQNYQYIPLATNAIRQGFLIGQNILEPKLTYQGTQGTSGLQIFGLNIGTTGLTEEAAHMYNIPVKTTLFQDNYRPEFMPSTEKVLMKLVYDDKNHQILGGQLLSKYDITQSANTLSLAIQHKMTVEDLATCDFFFQPYFDRPWNYLNLLAQKALSE